MDYQGIIHRDIKPDNIFLTESHPGLQVVIGDFGLAIDEDCTMSVAGTRLYRSPGLETTKVHSDETDLFSLALTFRECLGYFPNAFARETVLKSYQSISKEMDLPELKSKTYNSETISKLEWKLIHQMVFIHWNEITRQVKHCSSNLYSFNTQRPIEHFVGRKQELNFLGEVWRSKRNNNKLIVVSGCTGIGVSQLVYKFAENLVPYSGFMVFNAHSNETWEESKRHIFGRLSSLNYLDIYFNI